MSFKKTPLNANKSEFRDYTQERLQQIDLWHTMDDQLLERYMKRDNSGKGWVCPACGSGAGPHGTGITRYKDDKGIWRYSCFSGREITNGDIIELMALASGLDLKIASTKEKMDNMRRLTGYVDYSNIQPEKVKQKTESTIAEAKEQPQAKPEKDYSTYIQAAQKNLAEGKKYLTCRGISEETAKRWGLGYFVDNYQTPRILIPMGAGKSFFGRAIDAGMTENAKMNYGKADISNKAALERLQGANQPVFVTEGVFDAMSLEQAGAGAVVALNSLNNKKQLFEALEGCKAKSAIILAFDRDGTGNAAASEYQKDLQSKGFPTMIAVLPDIGTDAKGKTDPNQIWVADSEALKRYVADAERKAKDFLEKGYNEQHRALEFMPKFVAYCQKPKTPTKTGFQYLDAMLGGGLYPGQLITFGAISSLGKTSFLLQAANQIALSGGDVLLFSLEMGKEELIAKSLSWITANLEQKDSRGGLKRSYREILNGYKLVGSRREDFNDEELKAIQSAIDLYSRKIAPHIYIFSAAEKEKLCMTAEEIRQEVKRYMAKKGEKPALIAIDYLQIVQPSDLAMDDKRATDEAVRTFKNIAVELDVPLVVVSSFNRASYDVGATFEAFKQSGLIEYSSDVVLVLQLKGAGRDNIDEVRARKAEVPRPTEIVILKNRSAGLTEKPIEYKFDPVGNQFAEEQGYFDNLKQFREDRQKTDKDKERRKELRKEKEKKQLRELKAENKAAEDEAAGKPRLYKPERELYPMIHTDVMPEDNA